MAKIAKFRAHFEIVSKKIKISCKLGHLFHLNLSNQLKNWKKVEKWPRKELLNFLKTWPIMDLFSVLENMTHISIGPLHFLWNVEWKITLYCRIKTEHFRFLGPIWGPWGLQGGHGWNQLVYMIPERTVPFL